MSALDARRQAAREAYWDVPGGHTAYPERWLDVAIETATRVRITPQIILAFTAAAPESLTDDLTAPFRAAFEAAGFEVVE
jgi:hypothetical protein